MNDDRMYSRRPTLVSANLGEELAVLDLASNSYLGFNATAAQIWRLLQDPRSLDQIRDAMLLEFQVDADQCRGEISMLLENLLAADLIVAVDARLA
jgi:Coenzyme PQQ synthesis protein D (PqqD)